MTAELKERLAELEESIENINGQIADTRTRQDLGQPINEDWFRRALAARRFMHKEATQIRQQIEPVTDKMLEHFQQLDQKRLKEIKKLKRHYEDQIAEITVKNRKLRGENYRLRTALKKAGIWDKDLLNEEATV